MRWKKHDYIYGAERYTSGAYEIKWNLYHGSYQVSSASKMTRAPDLKAAKKIVREWEKEKANE